MVAGHESCCDAARVSARRETRHPGDVSHGALHAACARGTLAVYYASEMMNAEMPELAATPRPEDSSLTALARYFLRLGTFGFGGPIALVGYMQRDLVEQRHWFSDA